MQLLVLGRMTGKIQLNFLSYMNTHKMDVQEVGGGRRDWMELAQDRDRWWTLVSTVKNLQVP
jgi:hypothetical protein